jgi:uncharacterized protein YbjT (DUF2867 family)
LSAARKTAVVAGSTGLVGSRLIELLVAAPEYQRVIALARRPGESADGTLQWRAADFDHLDALLGDVRGSTAAPLDVFCCLGTTIKTAGSEEAFRRVDFDYVIGLGRWASQASARRMVVVSALGANSASRVFYKRVKGEAEQALRALGLASLVILQPSLLDGSRKEFRLGERLTLAALRPVRGLFPRSVRPVRDVDVAATMLEAARADTSPGMIASAAMHGAANRLAA